MEDTNLSLINKLKCVIVYAVVVTAAFFLLVNRDGDSREKNRIFNTEICFIMEKEGVILKLL